MKDKGEEGAFTTVSKDWMNKCVRHMHLKYVLQGKTGRYLPRVAFSPLEFCFLSYYFHRKDYPVVPEIKHLEYFALYYM